jgi:hypothetical protein
MLLSLLLLGRRGTTRAGAGAGVAGASLPPSLGVGPRVSQQAPREERFAWERCRGTDWVYPKIGLLLLHESDVILLTESPHQVLRRKKEVTGPTESNDDFPKQQATPFTSSGDPSDRPEPRPRRSTSTTFANH